MTTHTATIAPRQVLVDLIPTAKVNSWVRDAVLVTAGAGLVGASAQVAIPLPGITPVPLVLTTLTVLLLGAAYGPLRAAATMGVYLVAGIAGVPWFSEGASGLSLVTLGYITGFLAAATVVGALARRGGDRTLLGTAGIMIVGNLVIYAFGVPYLVLATGMSWGEGLMQGAALFVIADLIKLVVASALLPGTWALVKRFRG
ncbi:biotin transport system substrate-specific component [Stackebrandtia endophytica]|uniref:Biotin transporter n=1 Tax=Stackebrandtia endophytica TaxID=1496996 RepID=A0A543ARS5_9ACTN|nr:biotin transporter BioY [Stackebrandtia endophytica]TQL75274.1 biotin transport system substrate-specific component [Stackebrandtia endophytica]